MNDDDPAAERWYSLFHELGLAPEIRRYEAEYPERSALSLDFADFEPANLFGADMRRASLVRTSFRGASLYGAVLLGAATSTADFTGASLGAATRDPT